MRRDDDMAMSVSSAAQSGLSPVPVPDYYIYRYTGTAVSGILLDLASSRRQLLCHRADLIVRVTSYRPVQQDPMSRKLPTTSLYIDLVSRYIVRLFVCFCFVFSDRDVLIVNPPPLIVPTRPR